jgi:signal transduction histidine kinase
MGQLLVAPRARGDVFSPSDHRLIEDLARETSTAVRAVLLTLDLQRSRERLVTAREEERRRLRRDLHDGLGPTLSSVLLKVAAARRLLDAGSPEDLLLTEVRRDVQQAVADIRQLVHALRPPILDELGLVEAIRHQAAQYEQGDVQIEVVTPDHIPALTAAVEVAVYRIVQEALTNVVRHSGASHCTLHLSIEAMPEGSVVALRITDNGHGLSMDSVPGVGMHAMRERVAELNGSITIGSLVPSGTEIHARIPAPWAETAP